jgi:C4-dicarboxylate transporter DctM subunit
MILLILMAAFTLQFAFAAVRISLNMAEWVASFDLNQVQLILALVVFYLVLGTFMESYSMMLTTLPILIPVLSEAGVDKLWFGIIMVILLEAGPDQPTPGHGHLRAPRRAAGLRCGVGARRRYFSYIRDYQ